MGFDMSEVDRLADDLAAAPARVAARGAFAVDRAARSTARDASILAPKRTGYLSEHIEAYADGLSAQVVATAPYAEYVEDGTSDTAPQPFMRPAAERNLPGLAGDVLDAGADIL